VYVLCVCICMCKCVKEACASMCVQEYVSVCVNVRKKPVYLSCVCVCLSEKVEQTFVCKTHACLCVCMCVKEAFVPNPLYLCVYILVCLFV
jgi:hypothetical protein